MDSSFVPLALWLVLVGVAISMVLQAFMIAKEMGGYKRNPRDFTRHPEIEEMDPDEKLLSIKFNYYADEYPEGYDELQKRIDNLKRKEQNGT